MKGPDLLTVARLTPATRVLGPGCRAAVWFHGCGRACPGCIAASMNGGAEFAVWKPEELAEWCAGLTETGGVTLSGGEPLAQDRDALGRFLTALRRRRPEGTVILYTGYEYREVRREAALACVDLLVDGAYRRELDDGRPGRGSANQRLLALSPAGEELLAEMAKETCRRVEFEVDGRGGLAVNGIPPPGFLPEFTRRMREKGLEIGD